MRVHLLHSAPHQKWCGAFFIVALATTFWYANDAARVALHMATEGIGNNDERI